MDKVYEELDEAKAEIQVLKAELKAKTNSLENLKISHNAQANQIQEAKSKAEKLDQNLLQQADEISEAKLVWEDLKGTLNKKESIIKHLSAANDKLRLDCDDKIRRCEEEKRELVLALDEKDEKAQNQEQQIYQYKQEIERLKGCLSVSKEKCLESEKKIRVSKELRERDDMFNKLEEESRKVEDQLKWKKEQFKHLEEAHDKLRDQFKSSKKEWDMEKSTLLDEISSIELKLDSQIRISEDLQHQLQNCHQALAHVESQKKHLEVEVSNLKLQLDDASNENQDARSQLDCLNTHRDKDIADLRYLLKTKEAYHKESKYRTEKLEQENQELLMSLKEVREAQIQEVGASYSQSKLRSKLRNLEQTHKECASTLKVKEAQWNFKLKQLTEDLNKCQSELETKIEVLEGLQMELERSRSSAIELKLLNEEMSVMLLVLKQGISEAQLKLVSHTNELDLISKTREEEIFQLMKQLEMKDAALISAHKRINEEREDAACLMRQVETDGFNNELQCSLQNELDKHKEMLEESTRGQLILKEKVMQMECNFEEQLKEIHDALDSAIIELDDTICERNEMEFELQIWKSIVERLKNDLEENQVVRRELETSLIAQVDVGESLKQEKDSLVCKLEEKEAEINLIREACDKITASHILAALEIEEKKLMVVELEDDIQSIQQKMKLQEENWGQSEQLALDTEVELGSKQLKVMELNDQMETRLRKSDALLQKLKMENRHLVENATRLSSERENLLAFFQGLSDKICELSTEDTLLMGMLRNMVQSFENDCPVLNLKKDDCFHVKENILIQSPTRIKKPEANNSDNRSPFKELNLLEE